MNARLPFDGLSGLSAGIRAVTNYKGVVDDNGKTIDGRGLVIRWRFTTDERRGKLV